MNEYKDLMNKTEEFVIGLYKNANQETIVYHNLNHTKTVVTRAFEIASHYELTEKELAELGIAAWFHDVGHLFTSPSLHEVKSVEIMKQFMEEHKAAKDVVDAVECCILATKVTNQPSGLLQEIIRDADTYHFGTKDFKENNKLVKKENEMRGLNTIVMDWDINTLNSLKAHKFYTSYCLETLSKGKEKNIAKAEKKASKTNFNTSSNIVLTENNFSKKKIPKRNSFVTKGIQTSLRLSSENHLRLSDMADSKANILISVNAIIISVILTVLLRKIEVDKHLTIPTFIFLGFSVATIIIAIIATRPKITTGDFSREDVLNKRTNLLFFGNFYNRSLEEFSWAMGTMMRDSDYLYGSMVQDIYHLGVVLGKKYKLLRSAYGLFMIGIIASVTAFSLAIALHNPASSTVINSTGGVAILIMYYNRDLSWLSFNDRVLQEATDTTVPVMEKIKFLSIFSSNLDEFFKVRFPAMVALSSLSGKIRKKTTPPTDKNLATYAKEIINKQLLNFGNILKEQVLPELKDKHIILYYDQMIRPEHIIEIRDLFLSKILSFIQPLFISEEFTRNFLPENDKLYFLVSMKQKNNGLIKHAIINIPADKLNRFFELSPIDNNKYIIFIDDIIRENLDCIFPGFDIVSASGFKITRDSELLLDEHLGKDILSEIEKKLENREQGKLSRFLFQKDMPQGLQLYLKAAFNIKEEEFFEGGRYHNLKDLAQLPVADNELLYPQIEALQPFQTQHCGDIFDLISSKDILLHFPYHSYNPVLSFFNQAAIDPDVRSIHITLYRVAADSHIVNALISAAKNGKEVTAFVELKARFDEANNIKWSKEMKKAGIKLISSMPNIKVHSKIALIEKKGFSYVFIGTGNFNENTAKYYADHSLLTCNREIVKDLKELFIQLKAGKISIEKLAPKQLLISQVNMVQQFEHLIKEQITFAKKGLPALLKIKFNSLEDFDMIQLLYKASKAGVKIQLIVRGICCIAAGKKDLSENIEVRRIVDRYLEHSRIFIFGEGDDKKVFIGSADWMTRNLHYRIEVCVPINDRSIQNELVNYFELQWNDDAKAVSLKANNQQEYLAKSGYSKNIRSQEAIYDFLKARQT